MTDLVERLRGKPAPGDHCSKLIAEAADEIERLRAEWDHTLAEIERLRGMRLATGATDIRENVNALLEKIAVQFEESHPSWDSADAAVFVRSFKHGAVKA
jgi:hypothetical protein